LHSSFSPQNTGWNARSWPNRGRHPQLRPTQHAVPAHPAARSPPRVPGGRRHPRPPTKISVACSHGARRPRPATQRAVAGNTPSSLPPATHRSRRSRPYTKLVVPGLPWISPHSATHGSRRPRILLRRGGSGAQQLHLANDVEAILHGNHVASRQSSRSGVVVVGIGCKFRGAQNKKI
jgi:hypothetical protein